MIPELGTTILAPGAAAFVVALPGAKVNVTLEINVTAPSGIADDVVRTVSENANTLGFGHASFEE